MILEDKIKLLERHYKSFINQNSTLDFFLGFKDYIDFIENDTELNTILVKLISERGEAEKGLAEKEKKAIDRLNIIWAELTKFIDENKIDDISIKNEMGDFQRWIVGDIQGSSTLTEALYYCLSDTISILYKKLEYRDFLKKYMSFWDQAGISLKNYLDFQEIQNYWDYKKIYDEKMKNELWGHVSYIGLVYEIISKGKEIWQKLTEEAKTNPKTAPRWKMMNYSLPLSEWNAIQEGREKRNSFFDKERTKNICVRLHNYILRVASTLEVKGVEPLNNSISKIKFDQQVGVLRCGDITHKFHRGAGGNKQKLELFRKLWTDKKLVKNGIEKIKGTTNAPEYLAVQIGLIPSAKDFTKNGERSNSFWSLIKDINRMLKKKDFPAEVERKNGVQLIITQK